MTDLISRADAIEAVHDYFQKRFTEDSIWDAEEKMFVLKDKTIANDNMEICDRINALPSADAVEVVRCKDCKHKYVSGNGTTQYYVCDFMDAQYEEDGFCHHAESEVEE